MSAGWTDDCGGLGCKDGLSAGEGLVNCFAVSSDAVIGSNGLGAADSEAGPGGGGAKGLAGAHAGRPGTRSTCNGISTLGGLSCTVVDLGVGAIATGGKVTKASCG